MAGERSLEVKVGVLVLVGIGILAGLVLVMGGLSLSRRFPLLVDFNNPGGLQTGAPVKIAGVRVGTVDGLEFRGSRPDPATGRRSLVRVRILVDERFHDEIHDDAEFYVTTQGVLGEQFLAIEPGTATRPVIRAGSVAEGVDPPRIDLFVARAYALLDDTVTAVRANRRQLGGMVDDLSGVLHNTNEILHRNGPRIDSILANTDQTIRDADGLVVSARERYVDGPQMRRIVNRAEAVLATIERDLPPLAQDARALTGRLNRIADGVGGEAQLADLRATLRETRSLAERANSIAGDAQAITTHVRGGHGTVGALLMDEEIYDDLQELVRDLKHNPWKFFWRE
ncbi:MAG: MCE family protein [Deltaproteobacteria bacterium]|nr:MCE family protein [Deltaproteobacteria bacterium]